MSQLIIAGAGGHAQEVLDILLETHSKTDLFFFDDTPSTLSHLFDIPILKNINQILALGTPNFRFTLGVGSSKGRIILFHKFSQAGGELIGFKSKTAIISPHSFIHPQADIMKSCFVSTEVKLGQGTLLNQGAAIHHNCQIGSFTEIAPRALLLGNVSIGDQCFIGANATILPRLSITDNVIIGAASVVTKSISQPGTYLGNPAKLVNSQT
jgi:acetyltransferase EpsM